jgi:hypothetical protein
VSRQRPSEAQGLTMVDRGMWERVNAMLEEAGFPGLKAQCVQSLEDRVRDLIALRRPDATRVQLCRIDWGVYGQNAWKQCGAPKGHEGPCGPWIERSDEAHEVRLPFTPRPCPGEVTPVVPQHTCTLASGAQNQPCLACTRNYAATGDRFLSPEDAAFLKDHAPEARRPDANPLPCDYCGDGKTPSVTTIKETPLCASHLQSWEKIYGPRRERASRVSETTGKCATCHATGRNLTDGKQCPAEGCPAAPNACAEGPRDATLERVQAWLLEHGDCAGHEYDLCALVDAAIAAIAPIGRLSNTRVVDESPLTFDPEPLTAEKAKALLLEGRELRRHVEEGYDRVAREPADRPCVTCAVEPALPGKLHCAGHEAGSWATPIPCVEPVFGLLRSSWTATLDLAAQNADWRLVDEVRHEMAGRQPLGPRTLLDPAMATADSSSYAPPVVKTAHTIALIEQVRRETLDGAAAVFDSHAAAYENCSSPEAYCGAASQLRGVATQLRAMAAEKGSVTK